MKKFLVLLGVVFGVLVMSQGHANADEVTVSSWSDFVTAWNNPDTTKITLAQDFETTATSTQTRTAGIEINGNGHKITFSTGSNASHSLSFRNPASSAIDQSPSLNVHDIDMVATQGEGVNGFIYNGENKQASNWTVKMSNLTYKQTFNGGQRFATVGGAKVRLSGTVDIRTNYENFIGAQDIEIADGTHYYGVSNASSNNNGKASATGAGPVSVWYMTSTAGDGHITIGNDAVVSLVNYHTYNPYSPIYLRFGEIHVQPGATFNLNGGTAGISWYLNAQYGYNGHYIVDSNATMSVSSNTPNGAANIIDYSNTTGTGDQGIAVKSQGSLYVMGNQSSGVPLIAMTGGNANQYLTLTNPKGFDINNQGTGNNAAINVTRGKFSITDSNATLWNNGLNTTTDAASSAFEKVASFTYTPANGVVSSDSGLQTAYKNNSTARISGLNQPLKIYVQPWSKEADTTNTTMLDSDTQNGLIWDTDKTVRARVSMGQLPVSGKPDPDTGLLTYHDVWAIKDQVTLTGNDSLGHTFSKQSGADGFVTLSNDYFQKATPNGGQLLSFYGKFGDYEDQVTADVNDKTPPTPVSLTSSTTPSANVSGKTDAGATVTAKVSHDGGQTWVDAPNTATADADGNFSLGVIEGLAKDDIVQVFSTDDSGNTNPVTDTTVHDADLKAAPTYMIAGDLAWAGKFTKIDFGSHGLKSGNKKFAATENATGDMTVSDTRGTGSSWRVTASMAKQLTSSDGAYTLNNNVMFRNDGDTQPLTNEETVIMDHTTTSDDDTVKINQDWNDKDTGLFLEIPGTKQPVAGSYSGEINWSLQDVPANN